MTKREFMNRIARSKDDFLQRVLDILKENHIQFCAIGGLAVNAYAEPVVSLDLDIVITADKLDIAVPILKRHFSIKEFANSINITVPASDLRIQLQTDPRYQAFIKKASSKNVLGYVVPVARIEDILRGKIWAAMDEGRRPSKRQKDLADIARLVEVKPSLIKLVPQRLKKQLFKI